ncbi:MAG: hypothetical protein PHS32_06210 [Rhodoferax sp.]|uniref:hypothetical protein n=1 Tax=Rhodoferax sp. TaxID=50421 RepID=UPI002622BA4B|nr:hypothetical protein [Rhodoferax sp.]MDD5333324.1 hypothetical protein [Rhodoferax sp.]
MNRPIEPPSTQESPDPTFVRDILRNRMATDDLLERLRKASNELAAGLDIPFPGLLPACSSARNRAKRIDRLLWAVRQKAASLREQQMSELPELTQVRTDILAHLDRQMLLLGPALGDWFEGQVPHRGAIGKSRGDWIEIDNSVWIKFQFRHDLDSELSQSWPLELGWQFGRVLCRWRCTPSDDHPHFEFQSFADELKTVDRRERSDVKSELLLAVLPRIPELAFAAKFVERLSLQVGNSRFTAGIAMSPGL